LVRELEVEEEEEEEERVPRLGIYHMGLCWCQKLFQQRIGSINFPHHVVALGTLTKNCS
jgi:hypothetical protein